MGRIIRRLLTLMLLGGMLMVVFTSCSGGGKNSGGSTVASVASTAPVVTKDVGTVSNLATSTKDVEAASIVTNQTINIGYGTTIDSLTPFRSNTGRNAPYFVQLYETLAIMDENKVYQPYVAKSWTTLDNGFSYDLEIWDNVTDSAGNHITAADVVWFIQESMKTALKPVYAKVEKVEQTGDYTFTIKFKSNIVGTLLMPPPVAEPSRRCFRFRGAGSNRAAGESSCRGR